MQGVAGGVVLLNRVTATGAGGAFRGKRRTTFQVSGDTSAGAGAVVVNVQVSNNGTSWLTLGTVSLVLSTTEATDGFSSDAPWVFVRGNVVSISGTGAAVSLSMGA